MTPSELEVREKQTDEIPEYRAIEFNEIMEYYQPSWLAYAGFTASVFASLSLPMFGFVLSKYIFVLSSFGNEGVSLE
jgi:ABC-type multidrug transport system fused ATPase/permease subunit